MGRKPSNKYAKLSPEQKTEKILKRVKNNESAARHRARTRDKLAELEVLKEQLEDMKKQMYRKNESIDCLLAENKILHEFLINHSCLSSPAHRQQLYETFYRPHTARHIEHYPTYSFPEDSSQQKLPLVNPYCVYHDQSPRSEQMQHDYIQQPYPITFDPPSDLDFFVSRPDTLGESSEPFFQSPTAVPSPPRNPQVANILRPVSRNSPSRCAYPPKDTFTPSDDQYGNLLDRMTGFTPIDNVFSNSPFTVTKEPSKNRDENRLFCEL